MRGTKGVPEVVPVPHLTVGNSSGMGVARGSSAPIEDEFRMRAVNRIAYNPTSHWRPHGTGPTQDDVLSFLVPDDVIGHRRTSLLEGVSYPDDPAVLVIALEQNRPLFHASPSEVGARPVIYRRDLS